MVISYYTLTSCFMIYQDVVTYTRLYLSRGHLHVLILDLGNGLSE